MLSLKKKMPNWNYIPQLYEKCSAENTTIDMHAKNGLMWRKAYKILLIWREILRE